MSTKLHAYYTEKESDRWKKISRWEVLAMCESDYFKFLDSNTLYLNSDKESPKLTFNRLQKTFRYYPNGAARDDQENAGMTISHLLAQEVISELETLNLCLKESRNPAPTTYNLNIRTSNSICEYPLEENGEKFITDIRIYFNEPHELALKWGGVLNLEIFVTSRVKGKKIAFFEDHKEALIEIKLSDKLCSSQKISEISQRQEQELRNYIKNAFSKQVYGNLLVSPSSEAYLTNKVIHKQRQKIEQLESRIIRLTNKDEKSGKEEKSKLFYTQLCKIFSKK